MKCSLGENQDQRGKAKRMDASPGTGFAPATAFGELMVTVLVIVPGGTDRQLLEIKPWSLRYGRLLGMSLDKHCSKYHRLGGSNYKHLSWLWGP